MKGLELVPASSGRASNLAFALLSLPRTRRVDAMLFYRFCRTIDDIADQPTLSTLEKHQRLQTWQEAVEHGLPEGLETVLRRYSIDRSLLMEVIKGCASDIQARRFRSFADLEQYCWRVACAVGLVSIRIFGCREAASEAYAVHLGHALQLTNILRDAGEDAAQGRIYLPLDDLARFGVTEEEILSRQVGPNFKILLRHEVSRARARFAAAQPPPTDLGPLLPARIMGAVYQKILDRMEREGFPVLQKRISINYLDKISCVLCALLQRC
ncbi:MAG: squalene/phytoene synthase family protein [bacterium]